MTFCNDFEFDIKDIEKQYYVDIVDPEFEKLESLNNLCVGLWKMLGGQICHTIFQILKNFDLQGIIHVGVVFENA